MCAHTPWAAALRGGAICRPHFFAFSISAAATARLLKEQDQRHGEARNRKDPLGIDC